MINPPFPPFPFTGLEATYSVALVVRELSDGGVHQPSVRGLCTPAHLIPGGVHA